MTRIRLVVAVGIVLVLGALAPGAGAQPTNVEVFGFRGTSAWAYFRSTEGCIDQEVYVIGVQTIATAPGTRSGNRSGAAVSISRRDGCTGKLLFLGSAGGSDVPVTFSWDPRLTAAELHGTATILNVAPGAPTVPVPIRVDIAWTGEGELERSNSHYQYEDEGVLVTLHDNGALRFATAAGTATDGATQFISGGTSVLGWIAWSNYGQVVYSPPGR